MNLKCKAGAILLYSTIFLFSCKTNPSDNPGGLEMSENIFLNQLGFCPNQVKIAAVPAKMDSFLIWDEKTGEIVFEGISDAPKYWDLSGDTVRIADFSSVNKEGAYYITDVSRSFKSYTFEIRNDLFAEVAEAAIKAFYFNRTYIPLEEKYAGRWARPAGHPDTVVLIHKSAASATRKEGDIISSPYGWYDAGDYNKYIVNSGITTWTLMAYFEAFPEEAKAFKIDIPEANNNIPDILDEAYFNLRWVKSMQDEDGGVYHKLTNLKFDAFVMPEKATNPRYVVKKSTAATLDFAALMTQSARVYAQFLPDFSKECLDAAKKAWQWAQVNRKVIYNQPEDVATGAYGDSKLDDEFIWAGIELYITTKDKSYLQNVSLNNINMRVPQWANVAPLGIISLTSNGHFPELSEASEIAKSKVIELANVLYKRYEEAPFKVSINGFQWGSNSDVANEGIIKLLAFKFTNDKKFVSGAIADLDYILGKNPTGYSFVTGFGKKKPMNIHHRPSGADRIEEPIPGFLAGGPTLSAQEDCGEKVIRSKFPAKAYVDMECSYATNEIAINWNAPLFFLAAGVNAVCK